MTHFFVGSGTAAMRARDLLARHGIRAVIRRMPPAPGHGCGYGVAVRSRSEEAAALLAEAGVPVYAQTEQEGGP